MELKKVLRTIAGTADVLLFRSLTLLAAVVCGMGYFCCYFFLWILALVFCGSGIDKVLFEILTGQVDFLHVGLYILAFLVCSVLATLVCSWFLRKIFGDRTDRILLETRWLGSFILEICTVFALLYDVFPGKSTCGLGVAVDQVSSENQFRIINLVLTLVIMMMNCSTVVLNEIGKAYREYKSHEIRIDSGESNLVKFIKRFRGSKNETTDGNEKNKA